MKRKIELYLPGLVFSEPSSSSSKILLSLVGIMLGKINLLLCFLVFLLVKTFLIVFEARPRMVAYLATLFLSLCELWFRKYWWPPRNAKNWKMFSGYRIWWMFFRKFSTSSILTWTQKGTIGFKKCQKGSLNI